MSHNIRNEFTLDQLRNYTGDATRVHLFYNGTVGVFELDATDTTSADNLGTVLIDGNSKRWKRKHDGIIYTEWFGAVGDGVTDDISAIQNAVDAVAVLGGASYTGGKIRFQEKKYAISEPIVLPRTGGTPTKVVHLEGTNSRSSVLFGLNTFPTGRGMIEWEAVTLRAWNQSIKNLTISMPLVDNTFAIRYKYNATISNETASITERLEIVMEDVYLEGSNEFHEYCIWTEGSVYHSRFVRVFNDVAAGASYNYHTKLFRFDSTLFGNIKNENTGLLFSLIQNCWGGYRRGGYANLLDGRLLRCTLDSVFVIGSPSTNLELINSYGNVITNLKFEGRSGTQLKLVGSSNNTFNSLSLGGPDTAPGGYSNQNGLVLESSDYNTFNRVISTQGTTSFTSKGVKAVSIDSNSNNNDFLDLQTSVTYTTEVEDLGVKNRIIGTDLQYYRPYIMEKVIDLADGNGSQFWSADIRAGGKFFKTNNSLATRITNFSVSTPVAEFYLIAGDANTEINLSQASFVGNNNVNFTLALDDMVRVVLFNSKFYFTIIT